MRKSKHKKKTFQFNFDAKRIKKICPVKVNKNDERRRRKNKEKIQISEDARVLLISW